MSKLVFIEANTTGTGMLALTRASAWGLEPVLYTNHPARYSGLAETGCAVHVCDTNDLEQLRRQLADTVSAGEIRGVTTTSEFYLEQVASLTAAYRLPGNSIEVIRNVRNKAETRSILAQAGILQPRFKVVRHESELDAAIRSVGLPCIVKPTQDSGSNGVRLCSSLEIAQEHMSSILSVKFNVRGQAAPEEVLIEEYVEAPEYSVETISWQGQTKVVGITQKSLAGFPYFIEAGHLFPAQLPPKQADAMNQTVLRALEVVGFSHGAAHTEVKWTEDGCSIIEINGRLAGGMIPELIRLTTGWDMLEQHLLCAYRGPDIRQVTYQGTAGIRFLMSKMEGQLAQVTGVEQAARMSKVKDVNVNIVPGEYVAPPQNAYQRLGYVIAHGESLEETARTLDDATELIQFITMQQDR
ncbi:ATP-grasp domain-containing protein [Paenibacillus sp. SYP-B4298]|uniref:ATP-grasp domain-containing protein n=1 Tax=Paenibacillus sp. SYP-B4298 TaxID=2996034 RepID=UPI0022DE319D|nr:ATP-grasp domain-containing protein [Paenibacillus sp. SYP-B4298]